MRVSLVFGACLALALSACEPPRTITAKAPAPTAVDVSRATVRQAAPPAKVVSPVTASIKPQNVPGTDILIGRKTAEILQIFGEPTLLRKEAPAEVWQYLSQNCALHLFFYPADMATEGGELEVRHIAVNNRDMSADAIADPKKYFAKELVEAGAGHKLAANG
ncbi:hypothetical protein [Sneathiella sp.]|uniref:hypothetical protein n=1 Tax=Sneathiella sp. TaxID=1964365 RepID=UPI003567A9B7